MTELDPPIVGRFAADLDRLSPVNERVGVAVSGGPDSLALLLLTAAARPAMVEAITIDHALRPQSRDEADHVAAICGKLKVAHDIKTVEWREKPTTGLQQRARDARYRLIGDWMRERKLQAVCTAHHRDDQAETLLMRLARGAGVGGLASIRPDGRLPGSGDLRLLRPLLDWDRGELGEICAAANVRPVEDPSNDDPHFERVRVRKQMARLEIDAGMLARSAEHLRAADQAIEWAADQEWAGKVRQIGNDLTYDPGASPSEIRRRIIARMITSLATEGGPDLRGREIDQLLLTIESGGVATLRGVRAEGGPVWRFTRAPPRALGCG